MAGMSRRVPIVLLAVLLAAGACGGGKKHNVSLANGTTSTTATGDSTTTTAAGTEPGAVQAGGSTTTVKGATTTVKAGTTGGTSGGSAGTAAVGAKPGTYHYTQTGTTSFGPAPGSVTTVVDAPTADGDQHSSSKDASGNDSGDSVLHHQADGVYLKDLKINAGTTKEFVFNPLALAEPQPAPAGKQWQWGPYTSTDGKTTINATLKVVRDETITVGGEQVACTLVNVVVKTSGDITSTSTQDVWTSSTYKLIVQEHDVVDGSAQYQGAPVTFHSDTTRKLDSTKPS